MVFQNIIEVVAPSGRRSLMVECMPVNVKVPASVIELQPGVVAGDFDMCSNTNWRNYHGLFSNTGNLSFVLSFKENI